MNRREYLLVAAAAGASATAGCSGSGGSGSSGSGGSGSGGSGGSGDTTGDPVSLDAPATVTVGETFDLTLTVRNDESEPTSFDKVIGVTDGPGGFSRRVRFNEIPPGETRTEALSVSLPTRGEYVFGVPGVDASTTVTTEPRVAGVGETATLANGVEMTLDGVTVPFARVTEREAGGYTTRYDVTSTAPPEGTEYVYATFRATPTGDEGVVLRREMFGIDGGSVTDHAAQRIAGEGAPVDRPFPLSNDTRVAAGEELAFRVLFEVPRSDLDGAVRVGVELEDDGTPPETVFEATADGDRFPHPSFELVSVDPPSLEADDPQGTLSFTVENTGEYPAEFVGTVNWQTRGGNWASDPNAGPDLHRAVVDPGATRTFETTWDGGDARTGTRTYRVQPFDRTFEITFE